MRRVSIVCLLVVGFGAASAFLVSDVADAACKVKTKSVVVSSTVLTSVPLAVSIGVPVAEVTPYYYSYSAYASQPAAALDVDALAAKIAERLAASGGSGTDIPKPAPLKPNEPVAPAPAPTMVAQKCAQCHSGPSPKGNLSLANPAALDCAARLKAIRAVLSEKMPQGGPKLSPDEAGKVLEELAGQ